VVAAIKKFLDMKSKTETMNCENTTAIGFPNWQIHRMAVRYLTITEKSSTWSAETSILQETWCLTSYDGEQAQ
jgi:hypothetical protein